MGDSPIFVKSWVHHCSLCRRLVSACRLKRAVTSEYRQACRTELAGLADKQTKVQLDSSENFSFLAMQFYLTRGTVSQDKKFLDRIRIFVASYQLNSQLTARVLHFLQGLLQRIALLAHRGRMNFRPYQALSQARARQSEKIRLDDHFFSIMSWWT